MVDAEAQRNEGTWHVWELMRTLGITNLWGSGGGQWKEMKLVG